jgi:putative NIF3 family GTP cyclohydrolase 1 type 2
VRLGELVAELDAYFRVPDVENDDWSGTYEQLYPDPYWRGYAEPGYEGRWNGLFVGGGDEIERVVTCVFPADWIISSLAPGTLLFSEHPIAFEDDVEGFAPLSRASFERLKAEGISFYHVHAPLDQHPEVSPSRLVAEGLRLTGLVEYYPIADGLPGGAAIVGESGVTVDELAGLLGEVLGPEIPVEVLSRFRERAGRVAVVAGGGADADILLASLERGCETFVTGNAATRCRLDFVQAEVRKFHALVDEEGVSVLDGTHYGLEKPPQLAMVPWFERLGLQAEFRPGKPERGPLS